MALLPLNLQPCQTLPCDPCLPPNPHNTLLQATDAANAAYCPIKAELCAAAGIKETDVLLFEPQTTTTRPAYAVWVDDKNQRIVWGFRGTTDLNVSSSRSSCVVRHY